MNTETFLLEIGTEELPPKALKTLSTAFCHEILNGLLEAELITDEQVRQATPFATPRRLAISVPDVRSAQPDQIIERRGPTVQAAFNDDGQATPAALGFAKSCGVQLDTLERLVTDKGEWLSFNVEQTGKTIDELIPQIIKQAIKRLPIAKRMRWGAGDAEFVRPVHWLIVMHGTNIIETSVLNATSSNSTLGHRFHSTGQLSIAHANDYQKVLHEEGHVIANFKERRSMIQQQVSELASQINGHIEQDPELLDEVTGLVEFPSAILGS
ncbi:UNVERIFIED_CONTAM: hypothetical protein GTU68_016485, partial [Idotea baltica]|nr:hypothetical protein [Idotea baltica]